MVKAYVTTLDAGYPQDKERALQHLALGKIYDVLDISMGQSHTTVTVDVDGKAMSFNSVFFNFEEYGEPLNIYTDKRFNPYLGL